MNDSKPKIIISAYAVSPSRGSECAVGWNIVIELCKYYDVQLIFCKQTPAGDNYLNEIIEEININPIKNLSLHPISMPKLSKLWTFLHDIGLWPFYYLAYNSWQLSVFRYTKKLIQYEPIDLIYQLNMIGFREPGYLWKLNKPFIWGPTNGFHSIPLSFLKELTFKDKFFQTVKHYTNNIQRKIAIRPKKAAKKAKLIYCVDKITFDHIRKWNPNTNVKILQETGLSVKSNNTKWINYSPNGNLNLAWSGMITPGKALHLLLESLLKISNNNYHLTVIGAGPQEEFLKKKYETLKEKITWKGWVSKTQAEKILSQNHLLVHTSLKEGTPHVILEALSLGIPVICHDTCGMGEIINDHNGFKIPYLNTESSISYIQYTLDFILKNPQSINNKHQHIIQNSSNLTWEDKAKKITADIQSILQKQHD